jgi:hypothetical protein
VSLAAVALLVALVLLAALAFGPEWRQRLRLLLTGSEEHTRRPVYDPGRERRAERKASELLRSVVGDELDAMYRDLGFIAVDGGGSSRSGYGYLIYPHRPIVAYESRSGELLNEYCVVFPDLSEPGADERLPDSDDVLAKWMALSGDERRLIADANMHAPGKQLDPVQVRRDLLRLREWTGRRSGSRAAAVGS